MYIPIDKVDSSFALQGGKRSVKLSFSLFCLRHFPALFLIFCSSFYNEKAYLFFLTYNVMGVDDVRLDKKPPSQNY